MTHKVLCRKGFELTIIKETNDSLYVQKNSGKIIRLNKNGNNSLGRKSFRIIKRK